jgi:hypothetical protein
MKELEYEESCESKYGKEEFQGISGYLAIYDLRGIQEYIFRSNRIKEIIGASRIVSKILLEALKLSFKEAKNHKNFTTLGDFKDEWRGQKEFEFLSEQSGIAAEVLYEGGGNLLVAFRTEELYGFVTRRIARYLLENSYSLGVVSACVEITGVYCEDYAILADKLNSAKAKAMPPMPLGNLPITLADPMTGLPASVWHPYGYDDAKSRFVSMEAELKLKQYDAIRKEEKSDEAEKAEKASGADRSATAVYRYMLEIDDMADKGHDSHVAVVHIDGNNIGGRIIELRGSERSYANGVSVARNVSRSIHESCVEVAFKEMVEALKEHLGGHDALLPMRPIITAGDEITFICKANFALALAEKYIRAVSGKVMYKTEQHPNNDKYKITACAGIAIVGSHFPFSNA